ncbi:hypothetical protein QBC37DRAFT_195803 [Rhypophila decipiens]|uniref:MHYT domain-containing protein n=1 Tax=Rhypophila decipiens TaxID=261697 RepID=A0AAN7B6P0_9PEZI|nr:hypothetical protein QBC37DRAFT_195803 [Rhypophila decipiens]
MASSTRSELSSWLERDVPVRYNPVIVALSFFVSFVGAWSTVELINRRTSRKGRHNHILLFGAAVSMGAVAIWCMHFIGLKSVVLLNGEPELQVSYSIGMTALSFFVPILVLLVAFYVVTMSTTAWWNVGLSGSLSGGSICGMHYLGNASIDNYRCHYNIAHVAGAAVIAATASTVALALFFVFRATWANVWWKRLVCALVLAGAVSGMHWVASLGTYFQLTRLNAAGEDTSSMTTVIVVACLSIGACFVMAGFAVYSAHVRKGYSKKAQRITLAAAVFDRHGRILVTPDGHLPSEEITSTFLQKTRDDVFSTAHPLFHWVFQASRNWPSITNLVEKMGDHLTMLANNGNGRNARLGIELVDDDGHFIENYQTIFKELFCLAASNLADKMDEILEDAGILWDEIFATGGDQKQFAEGPKVSLKNRLIKKANAPGTVDSGSEDLAEKGLAYKTDYLRHGSLMFLVRRVDSPRAIEKLEASGYCFADLRQVAPIIGSSMQIRTRRLEDRLRRMANYNHNTMQEAGVHVGLFAVQPRIDDNVLFDIVVKRHARNLLPSVKLPLERLEPAHVDFLRRYENLTLSALSDQLRRTITADSPETDGKFGTLLLEAITELRSISQDPIFDQAKLLAKITQIPCKVQYSDSVRPSSAQFITFSMMVPVHAVVHAPQCEFIPLQFFKVQQLVYPNSSHHAAFARSVHRELAPILNSIPTPPSRAAMSSSSSSIRRMGWSSRVRRAAKTTSFATRRTSKREDSDKIVLSPSRDQFTTANSSNHSMASLPLYQSDGRRSVTPSSTRALGPNSPALPPQPRSPLPSPSLGGAEKSLTMSLARSRSIQRRAQQAAPASPQPPQSPLPGSPLTPPPPPQTFLGTSYGGIMVSQEVTVVVDSAPADHSDLAALGLTSTSTTLAPNLTGPIIAPAVPLPHQDSMDTMDESYQRDSIEMGDVNNVSAAAVLASGGMSTVEVRRGDNNNTFVDEIFATVIDVPGGGTAMIPVGRR